MPRYRDERDDYERGMSYAERRYREGVRREVPRPYEEENERRGRYADDERDDYGRARPFHRDDYTETSGALGRYYRDEYIRSRYGDEGDYRELGDERRSYRDAEERRGPSRSHVRCREIMTRDVTVATRDATLEQVAKMMRDEDTGVIPVVDPVITEAPATTADRREGRNHGKLVGLITDRDIVIRAIAEGKDPRTTRAEEIMTTDIYTAQPNDRVVEVLRTMGDKQVRRIPVVDREGNLRGIISMADVALETEEDRELAHALEEISSGKSFWSRLFG